MTASGKGMTALITGASSGIGSAFAAELARHGFDLVLTARREDRLRSLAQELSSKHGVAVHFLPADLANPAAPRQLVEEIERRGWRVDALVNSAGYGLRGAYRTTGWEAQRDFMQVMVNAPTELAHRVLPGMVARRRGYIVNVASVAGLIPAVAGYTLYGAAKSFLVKFSLALHLEQEGSGVHVTALCPGFTRTEFFSVTGTQPEVSGLPAFMWMTSERVAREGYAAVVRNQPMHVPGVVNKVFAALGKYLPDAVALAVLRPSHKRYSVDGVTDVAPVMAIPPKVGGS